MDKNEIFRIVSGADNTVLSFPERGPWGSSSYRGNCSGFIPAYFIWKYGINFVSEIFAGSGTTSDVCRDLGIPYIGIDLNPNPVRKNIRSMDILDDSMELPEEFYEADMCFLHPPYPGINMVRYSTGMWKGNADQVSRDIQEMSYKEGMKAVNHAVMRAYNSLQPGGYEVVLVGEIRSKGEYYSMLSDLVRPTKLHQTFVKLQHNCVSNRSGNGYSKSDRALTGHEMIAVFKKASGYEIAYVIPKEYKLDIRDSENATWSDVIHSVMWNLKDASLEEIYNEVKHSRKALRTGNNNVEAKIRQTLQRGNYNNYARGRWAAPGVRACVAV